MDERIPPKERIFNMTREEILMSDPEDLMYYGYSEEDIWDAYETQMDIQLPDGPMLKSIEGYPNYEVSEYGDVVSYTKPDNPVSLKTWTNQYGHQYVQLRDGKGNNKKVPVHRVVAQAFIRNPDNLPVVRHLDDNPANNCVDNLAWGTQKDNMRDCIDHGRNYHKSVYCYETDTVYHSGADAADELGCDRTAISQACSGKNHTANGYHVCFVEDKEDRLNNLDSWVKENHNYKSLHAKNLKTGEELYFESRKEASKTLGISDSCISLVIHGRIRQSHGWTFWED